MQSIKSIWNCWLSEEFKDSNHNGDGHQRKFGILKHYDIKVMFNNMASNSGLHILTKNHNFKIWSVLWVRCWSQPTCLPVCVMVMWLSQLHTTGIRSPPNCTPISQPLLSGLITGWTQGLTFMVPVHKLVPSSLKTPVLKQWIDKIKVLSNYAIGTYWNIIITGIYSLVSRIVYNTYLKLPNFSLMLHQFIVPHTQRSCWGVYWFHSIHPSVRPSVHPASRVHSVAPTVLVGSISYLCIVSSNCSRCAVCKASCKISNIWNFGNFFKFVTLTLSCFYIWDLMWITSMGDQGAVGGISECRHSSCSSLCI